MLHHLITRQPDETPFQLITLASDVSDYAAVYRHFADFAEATVIGRGKEKITEDDIDLFLEKFLSTGFHFWYEGIKIPHANNVDPETQIKAFDMTDKTLAEATKELKPLLMLKVQETYGQVSDEPNEGGWDPTPTSQDDFARMFYIEGGGTSDGWEELSEKEKVDHPAYTKAQLKTKRIKAYITKYFDKVMPFMLRKTMHHPISMGTYFTRSGGSELIRNDEFRKPVTLDSEEDMQEFLSMEQYSGNFPGGKNSGNRFLFWNPTTDGKDVKMMVIDIDNPAKIPANEVRKSVKAIASKMMREGHPTIIMFTGGEYQVWIGSNGKNPLGNQNQAADYVTSMMYGMGATSEEEAIANDDIWIDRSTLNKNQLARMFFSLHYPTKESKKQFSGLAAVPVTIDDLMTFEPYEYAHPDVVRRNFDAYASVVASWFDAVRIGQDYDTTGDLQADPECIRLEERFNDYAQLELIHTKANTIGIRPDEIATKTTDESQIFAYSKQRGVDAILRFDHKGNMKFGKVLTKEKRVIDKRGDAKLSSEQVKAVLVTRNGIVIHSDYSTRELERFCIASGIKELTLVGQLVMTDDFGTEQDIQEVQSMLAKKGSIDADDMKKTRFICSYIGSYNYDEVPLAVMEEELSKISTNRIFPAPSYNFTKPVGKKLISSYKSNRDQRLGKDMVIMGDETYFVSSLNKMSVAIVGVDRQSQPYKSESKELGPVFIALVKNHSKMGPIYYLIGKAEMALKKEDRVKLKELVYGDNNRNRVPINIDRDDVVDMIDIVEPTVVVDIVYDDVSRTMTNAFPFLYLPSDRGQSYRALASKRGSFVTKIIGAKVVAIRSDLNPKRPSDISHKQESLLLISGSAPKQGFSILNTLPNPSEKVDFYEYYTARMPESIDNHTPWKMSPKSYSKLNKLSKTGIVGFVKNKSIIFDDDPGWSIVGDYEELMDSAFTFKKITSPFFLRGIDVINATKMAVEYGVNYHLIISEGIYHWIYCEIESESLKERRDELFATGKDKGVKKTLSDLLGVVSSLYSPKEKVTDAVVPGFELGIIKVQQLKSNPAFSGVDSNMGSFYSSPMDAIPLDEPIMISGKYSNDYIYQTGGKTVRPHLFDSKKSMPKGTPAEFEKAYNRWDKDEEGGFGIYIDQTSENTTGDSPHYKYTGLPLFMHTAVDDHKNAYGIDGVPIISSGNTIERNKSYREAFNATKLANKEQAKEDMKIVGAQFTSFPDQGKDWSVVDPDFRGYDQTYKAQYKQEEKDLKKALKSTNFRGFDQAIESVLSNPPVKRSAWNALVTDYINQFMQWELDPEPKEMWSTYSLGLFPTWAVPMLEKERLFNLAQMQYELSDEDIKVINSNLAGDTTDAVFDPILSDLYEEEDEDEEGFEEDEDDEDEL